MKLGLCIESSVFEERREESILIMDQISIKTPNPKCRLFLKLGE